MSRGERIVLAILGLLTILRLATIGRFELSADEAYYVLWSEHLDLAYYSKGPGIALAIRLGTALFGHSEFGVRLLSPLLAAGTSLCLFATARRLSGPCAACLTLLLLNALPIFNGGALLMTIDPLSACAWAAALLAASRALSAGPRAWCWWLLVGALIGVGFLCKPTNAAFLAGLLAFALVAPARIRGTAWRGLAWSVAAFVPFTLPVLVWNAQHDWVTLTHLAERGGLTQSAALGLPGLLEFVGVHFGVYSPLLFLALVVPLPGALRSARTDDGVRLVLSISLPLLLGYLALSFKSSVEPNWTGPAMLGLAVLAGGYWAPLLAASRRWRVTAGVALGSGALLALIGISGPFLARTRLALPVRLDPTTRVQGWRQSAAAVDAERARVEAEFGREVLLVATHYGLASELAFYSEVTRRAAPGQPTVHVPATEAPRNQYWFWPGLRDLPPQPVLLVSASRSAAIPASITETLPRCEPREDLVILRADGAELRRLHAWACQP